MKIEVWVKAGMKHASLAKRQENIFDIAVKERPTDGKANEAVIEVLARHFNVTKKDITLVRGASSRRKLFAVHPEEKAGKQNRKKK